MKPCHLDNMDRPRGSEENRPDRGRQIPYNFTYMWNLKNKTNEQAKQQRIRFIETENILVIVRGDQD